MEKIPKLYSLMRPIVTLFINVIYTPQYINADYIPKKGRAVIAGNHKFPFDPLLIDICAKKRCVYSMMWYEYYDRFPMFFKSLGTIRVEPKVSNSLGDAIKHLNDDLLINIFPEGEMNKTKEILLPFKRGAITMAQETNSPIIPFVIKGEWKFRSKDLRIVYGKPINVSNMSFIEGNKLLYDTIKKMLIEN